MDDEESQWKQYGDNPHLQRNNLTKEFRCKTCNMLLGDNAGGAGSHCKGTHGIRIDGTPIKKEIAVIPPKVIPQTLTSNKNNTLADLLIKDGQRKLTEHRMLLSDHGPPTTIQKFDSKTRIWLKYKQGEREGMPDELLKPLREELGIQSSYEQKQIEEKAEMEKRKKAKEEKMEERERINAIYTYCYFKAKDQESANKIFNAYLMRLFSLY